MIGEGVNVINAIADYISKSYIIDIDVAQQLVNKSKIIKLLDSNDKSLYEISQLIINELENEKYCQFNWRQNLGNTIRGLVAIQGWSDAYFLDQMNKNTQGVKLPDQAVQALYSNPRLRDWMIVRIEEIFEINPGALLHELSICNN